MGDYREGTRKYAAASTERVAVSGSSAQSAAVQANEVMLIASTACFVERGANPTANTTTSIYLPAQERFHMRIEPGDKLAVIQETASGYLYVTAAHP